MNEEQTRQIVRQELQALFGNGKIVFTENIKLTEGKNIETGTLTGSKFGGSDTAKLSVYSATSVVRANHIDDPANGATIDTQARTAINAILVVLENFGINKTS